MLSRPKRSGRITYHFGLGAGESVLSDWIEKNARVSWLKHDRPWELESELISELVLPLNVQDNDRHPFAKTLRNLRHKYFGEALQKRTQSGQHREGNPMQLQDDYFAGYRSLKLTRDADGVLVL